MENLATTINTRYTTHIKKTEAFSDSIKEILQELSTSPTHIFTAYMEITDPQLAWEITIIDKTATLTFEQISSSFSEALKSDHTFKLKQCISNIILAEFNWE